jgi:hypothetical protein
MQRYLLPSVLILALLLVGLAQLTTPIPSQGQGDNPLYGPIVLKAPEATLTSTPTMTPTPSPTETPTMTPTATSTEVPPTPSNNGNGVYKLTNLRYYPNYNGTLAFGFVHFADGSPAWGGPENFHVYVSLGGATHRSSDLDATGYWQIPINGFPAPPIRAAGHAWVTHGSGGNERRVSENFNFDTNNGTCWQLDFRECTESDTDPVCQLAVNGYVVEPYEATEAADIAGGTCPP